MHHVLMYSGGIGSWYAGRRLVRRVGPRHLTLLFTDTLIEDPDLYRFLVEGAQVIFAGPRPARRAGERLRSYLGRLRAWRARWRTHRHRLVRVADGRTPWEVFRERRFLGNTRVDLCSRILKREMADRWIAAHFTPDAVTVHVGIDWSEEHRFTRLRDRKLPWRYEAPLTEPPYVTKDAMLAELRACGVQPPRLYALGFAHNNCGGGCIKAGLGHFTHLLQALPEVYAEWERNEAALAEHLGKPVAILRDRAGGSTKPLTLTQLRRRVQEGASIDMFDIGGCGCFSDIEGPDDD